MVPRSGRSKTVKNAQAHDFLEIREKVFPRKHRDKCRQKRFRSMCSVKKAERKIYAPICSEIRSNGDRNTE